MSASLLDNIYIVGYLLVWLLTFGWYHLRFHRLDAGSAIMGSYILYAFYSIISLNDDLFSIQYDSLRLFPFLYLYVMLMIALSPAIFHHFHPVIQVEDSNSRVLKPICWLLIFCALLLLPDIISNFGDGVMKLFTDVDAGNEAYEEQKLEADESGAAITNLPAIVFNAFYDIGVFLGFYFISRKKRNLVFVACIFLTLIVGLLMPVMKGQRGIVIINVSTVIMCYMLFQEYLSPAISRWIRFLGLASLVVIMLPIAAITVSRFGERNAGVSGYISWYVGQANLYFNNSALDAGGIRYGDRTLNQFKRLIDPSTPKNFVERRDKYHNLEIDDYYFTTFVGDFALDFGPIVAFLIFVVFNCWVLSEIRPRGDTAKLHHMLLIYFTMCVCMQGGMTLFSYSDSGNFRMILIFALYFYLRYRERLLQVFPLLSKND